MKYTSADRFSSIQSLKAAESGSLGYDSPADSTDHLSEQTIRDLKTIALYAADLRYEFDDLATASARCGKALLKKAFSSDPFILNYILNSWEYATGQTILESYPFDITVPVSETCNASCRFCNSFHNKCNESAWLDVEVFKKFGPLVSHALCLGFVGYGEPLMHPRFGELVRTAQMTTSADCAFYTITNGMLLDRYSDVIANNNFTRICISLNAATAATHEMLMGLGHDAFDRIVRSIWNIKERKPDIQIALSFVVTNHNIAEIPDFIELARSLRAVHIYFRSLNYREIVAAGDAYQSLPPYLNPDFDRYYAKAIEAIECAPMRVDATPEVWKLPVMDQAIASNGSNATQPARHSVEVIHSEPMTRGLPLPGYTPRNTPMHNPYGRKSPLRCKYPYSIFNISNLGKLVTPCCFMQSVPGFESLYYDGTSDFFEIWNSPAYQELRRRLFAGPLYGDCLTCLK